ncbi:MAG: DUF1579 domain-containing protein [Pirellulaceae bacterium]|nr:DUF1579 domain-containing protein [Pirellulaceae bacterium]
MRRLLSFTVALALFAAAASALAQAPPEFPKPGPEHAMLKQLEGTWDCVMTMHGSPAPLNAVATYKMELGGLWLASDFKCDSPAFKFQGRGLDSYDQASKKYVSVWVDSMVTSPMMLTGTYDEATKKLTMTGEAPGPSGKPEKVKTVSLMKDADHMTFQFFMIGEGGTETQAFSIEYTRRK